jgi:flagellar protein FliO/FliZ
MSLDTYFRFLLALVFVLALIGGCAWLAKRFGFGYGIGKGKLGQRGRSARLGIVEIQSLDARRKLILVRRDDVEHLLLLGAGGETVVETNIRSGASAAPAPVSVGQAP